MNPQFWWLSVVLLLFVQVCEGDQKERNRMVQKPGIWHTRTEPMSPTFRWTAASVEQA